MTEGRSVEQWLNLAGSIAAPTGLVSALLFYFGYASTRAKYAFFGVDVDVVGLGTRDFLLRSPQPLFAPFVILALLGLLAARLHITIHRTLESPQGEASSHTLRHILLARVARLFEGLGAIALGTGVALLVGAAWLSSWTLFDMVTPATLMCGVLFVTYGRHVRIVAKNARIVGPPRNSAGLGRTVWVLCAVVLSGSAFWATSTLAEWSGRGQAISLSGRFGELPRVILDTKERLYIQNAIIRESLLPPESSQTFRFRYRNLRLLVEGEGRLFLVPEVWSRSGTTLVVPLDGDVRVQFQFQSPG